MGLKRHKMNKERRLELLFELLVFGIVVGVIEDLVAVTISTGEPITWKIVGIVILIAIPFAIIGELVADRIDFVALYYKFFGNK